MHVVRSDPQVIPEVVGRLGVLALPDEHVLLGIARRRRDVAGRGDHVRNPDSSSSHHEEDDEYTHQRDGDIEDEQQDKDLTGNEVPGEQGEPGGRQQDETRRPEQHADAEQVRRVVSLECLHRLRI